MGLLKTNFVSVRIYENSLLHWYATGSDKNGPGYSGVT